MYTLYCKIHNCNWSRVVFNKIQVVYLAGKNDPICKGMPRSQKHINAANQQGFILISNTLQRTHKSRYQRALFSSNKGPATFWPTDAVPGTAVAWRGSTRQYGDSKQNRWKANKVLKRKRLQFRVKRDSVLRLLQQSVKTEKTETNSSIKEVP
jgi:hypothetical protein